MTPPAPGPPDVEDLLRTLAPQVLGTLVRRHGHGAFDTCEDAVQEALLAAAVQWPGMPGRGGGAGEGNASDASAGDDGVGEDGATENGAGENKGEGAAGEGRVPENPRGWLLTVATRRLTDQWRSESARRDREAAVAARDPSGTDLPAPDEDRPGDRDDTLTLLFLCCHPALTPPSQVALTLRAVGGLTTAQIARAFLVPEPTMAQRISRAKQRIRAAGARFAMPSPQERDERLRAVLHVLYLVFNEGYAASSGAGLQRAGLVAEATRLARELHRLLPDDGEVAGLLALMLLTDARRAARSGPGGLLVPLTEQDRTLWDAGAIEEGTRLITESLTRSPPGPYQLQAAIAAVHAEAARPEDTDWPQILALYRLLAILAPNPMVTLNQAVALAMVDGPSAGLDLLRPLDDDDHMSGHHRLAAVRAHLLEMAGDADGALEAYRQAARSTTSLPERRYLESRASRLITPAP